MWLLASENFAALPVTAVYDLYTLLYGALVLVFAVYFWMGKVSGWIGTAAVSLFVIAANSLTLLDLPSIPGIPKMAGFAEISYSLLVIAYLLTPNVRERFFKERLIGG